MPATLEQIVYSTLSRSSSHAIHVLHQRLRRANIPLLIAFLSALFMFLRALSGAGYIDPNSIPTPANTLNYSHLAPEGPANGASHAGFGEHWVRFKEAVLSCPEDEDGNANIVELESDGELMDTAAVTTRRPSRAGVGCIRERLNGAMGLSKLNGPAVKQEDRNFEIPMPVDMIPSQKKRDVPSRSGSP